ncbi:hypothetical protein VNO80_25227 [Phaseolus coccineus]|uniref:Uncharacterized protein n=1 Tax=Phaseolus coccineus TaxID=3886 RepID=A0AAN9LTW3_PHACN
MLKRRQIGLEGLCASHARSRNCFDELSFKKKEEKEMESGAYITGTMDPLTPNRVAFPGVAGLTCLLIGCRVWWPEIDLALPKGIISRSLAHEASLSHAVGFKTSPHSFDMLFFPSSFPSARSRSVALPKPIIISVPGPHRWKGSSSKPYVDLPPYTIPLGMGVGLAQACAVKVVVHDLIKKELFKK